MQFFDNSKGLASKIFTRGTFVVEDRAYFDFERF